MEEWRAVKGTDGRLEVSSYGRVKSNLRDGRILKQQLNGKGYLRVSVTLDRVRRSYKVHRLVADAFIDNPENKPQVNHIDGNKTNNNVGNLEWVTNKENAQHAISTGLWDSVYKAAYASNMARRKSIVAKNIVTGQETYYHSISDAERELGTRHITDVLKGKRAQAKGYTFAYKEGGDVDVHH